MMATGNLTSIIQNTDSFQTANHGPVNQSFWGCRIKNFAQKWLKKIPSFPDHPSDPSAPEGLLSHRGCQLICMVHRGRSRELAPVTPVTSSTGKATIGDAAPGCHGVSIPFQQLGIEKRRFSIYPTIIP